MKEDLNIEELLNNYLDGEATQRQQIEVQRLIKHDPQVARRLRDLQKYQMLVSCLPYNEAPPDMTERIKSSLQTKTVLQPGPPAYSDRRGTRHLFARKLLAAAAMIVLVAVLSAVIYTILVPQSSPHTLFVTDRTGTKTPEPLAKAPEPFYGRLDLKTANFTAVDAAINRAVQVSDSLTAQIEDAKSLYTVTCDRQGLKLLLADLGRIWEKFDSAALVVDTDRFARQVVVGSVTAEQVGRIVNQDSSEERVKAAEHFAVSNKIAQLMPGKDIIENIEYGTSEPITIPKPVLTGHLKPIKKPAGKAKDSPQVHLTIVLRSSE